MATIVASAVCFGVGVLPRTTDRGLPAFDFYGYSYPNNMQAWEALWTGRGLFWNPYQDCGQPLFAAILSGFLSHEKVLFGFLGGNAAFIASAIVNLSIAGVGTFLLCRTLGLGAVAALSGALALELGSTVALLALWTPTHSGAYAWLPVAMWLSERLVRAPSFPAAAYLGIVLTAQALLGFLQISFFTYQLVALRIAWALLSRQVGRPLFLLLATGAAMALPLFLGALQLLPSLELARESLRALPLRPSDIGPGFSWSSLGASAQSQIGISGSFLPCLLAFVAALAARRRRSASVFFLLVVLCYTVLSVGPGSLLYNAYELLPLGKSFRGSARLLWVSWFALAVLGAFGAQTLLDGQRTAGPARAGVASAVVVGAVLLHAATPAGLRWVDWFFAAAIVLWLLLLGRAPVAGPAALALPALILINGLAFSDPPPVGLRSGDVYDGKREAFLEVRRRAGPQDRILIDGQYGDLSLMPRSAMVFRVPSIFDYEPQVTRSYAEFFTYMRIRRPLRGLTDFYWLYGKLLPRTLDRRLFDLTAARYLLVDPVLDRSDSVFSPRLTLLSERDGVRVYENTQALPRARFVAEVRVVEHDQVLSTLADASLDLRRVAVLDRAPRSGFLGTTGGGEGSVRVAVDEPERVVLEVRAPAPGFLYLADQHYPGWHAAVNGEEREILRANHTFRAVEVPAGESTVVFEYEPLSVRIGAGLSLFTALALAIALVRRRSTPDRQRAPNGR